MIKRFFRALVLVFPLLLSLLVLNHCTTGSGVPGPPGDGNLPAVPAPPVELPNFLDVPKAFSFPSDVGVNVDKVQGGAGSLMKLVTIGDDVSEAIEGGFLLVENLTSENDQALTAMSKVTVPVDPTVTTHEEIIDVGGLISIKIDFTPFDLDGDGIVENCTGCTCPLGCDFPDNRCPSQAPLEDLQPICYRVWVDGLPPFEDDDYFRFMAGLLERFPVPDDPDTVEDESNAGNGRFRALGSIQILTPEEFIARYWETTYTHRDPEDPLKKLTDFSQAHVRFDTGVITEFFSSQHIKVDQAGLPNAIDETNTVKTIQATTLDVDTFDDSETFLQYTARFREDEDFWSGSVNLDPLNPPPDFSFELRAACAQISTGLVTAGGFCSAVGIDVSEIPFLNYVDPLAITFPDTMDFPDTPTF